MKTRSQTEQIAAQYLKLVRWSDEDGCYVGSIPDLCGDCCHGDEQAEVYAKLVNIAEDLVDYYRDKDALPAAKTQPCLQVASQAESIEHAINS